VNEDITGLQAEDCRFRTSRVGAADPKDLRVLAFREGREEIGFRLSYGRSPGLIGGEGTDIRVCKDVKTLSAWWKGLKLLKRGGLWLDGQKRIFLENKYMIHVHIQREKGS
jgi:hypothetical protein